MQFSFAAGELVPEVVSVVPDFGINDSDEFPGVVYVQDWDLFPVFRIRYK